MLCVYVCITKNYYVNRDSITYLYSIYHKTAHVCVIAI